MKKFMQCILHFAILALLFCLVHPYKSAILFFHKTIIIFDTGTSIYLKLDKTIKILTSISGKQFYKLNLYFRNDGPLHVEIEINWKPTVL